MKIEDFNFVIFGATGDLTKRKLVPALYDLYKNKHINDNFLITFVARRDYTTKTFVDELKEFFNKVLKKKVDEKIWKKFTSKMFYYRTDFDYTLKMSELPEALSSFEKKHKIKENRIYYLSTLPSNYELIVKSIGKNKLNDIKHGWKKIVVEKPFGNDLKSAKKLNSTITKVFNENEVYRIDHYLTKETLNKFLSFRFNYSKFEKYFNNEYIEHAQITVAEDIGIEDRGPYYDKAGTLRDFLQNHLMQILTMITIYNPKNSNIKKEKLTILKNVNIANFVLGQYEGYRNERGVDLNSNRDTFSAVKLFVNHMVWKEVPFYLRTGKNLKKKIALIYIKFKDDIHLGKKLKSDELVIQIQPEKDIYFIVNKSKHLINLKFKNEKLDAHEKLILECIKGNQDWFVSAEETFEGWRIVDPITKLVDKNKVKVQIYDKKTWGPDTADQLIEKDRFEWFYY
ncbi:MAG TPA: glucose-6-phosphate dehydrogenase [Candidatus Nanoarchaeia archaeon]|nr:glucose-6-phosphate dehydrogenase [Candidatus Nanoarchaeia archaeon]